METFTYGIQDTGGDGEGYLFKHLTLTEGEYEKIISTRSLKEIAKEQQVDFISVIKEGRVRFLHVSNEYNYDSIDKNGLQANADGFTGDLGIGIYVIDESNKTALDNLKTYVMDESNDLLLVDGYYYGPYTECVYGEQHEGYIVLLANSIPEHQVLTLEVESVDDFLMRV